MIEADPTNPDVVFAGRPVRLRHRLGRHLPLRRRRPDLEEPRLGPAPGLPRARVRPDQLGERAGRLGRRRLVQHRPRRPPGASDPLDGCRLADLNGGAFRSAQFTSIATDPAWTSIATNPTVPARLWGGTQDNGTDAASRAATPPGSTVERRRRSGARRPDGLATTSTARTSASRPYRITDGGAASSPTSRSPTGINTRGPVGLLHPVDAEPGRTRTSCSSAPTGCTGRTTRRHRRPATSCGSRSAVTSHPVAPARPRTAPRTAPSPRSASAAATASTPAPLDGLRLGQPGRADQRHARRWTQVGRAHAPEPAGAADRGRPPQLPDRLRRLQRLQRRDPGPSGPRLHDHGRRQDWTDITRQPARRAGQLDRPRPGVPEHALRRHRRRAVRDLRTAAAPGRARRHRLPDRRGSGSSTSIRATASSLAGTHGRGAFTIDRRAPRAGARRVQGRRRHARSVRQRRSPTRSRSGTSATRTGDRCGHHRPDAGQHDVLSARGRRHVDGRRRDVDGPHVPAGGSASVHFTVQIDEPLAGSVTRRSSTTASRAVVRRGPVDDRLAAHHARSPAYAVARDAGHPDRRRQRADVRRPTTSTRHEPGYTPGQLRDEHDRRHLRRAPSTTATCTTPLSTTAIGRCRAHRPTCASRSPCRAARRNGTTTRRRSRRPPSAARRSRPRRRIKTIAVAVDTLLVDNDTNGPIDSRPYYTGALTTTGMPVQRLGPRAGLRPARALPDGAQERRLVHRQQLPGPAHCRTRSELTGVPRRRRPAVHVRPGHPRPGGGHDGFVHDYLHIDWDGTEAQNDKATADVHGVAGNPVTDGHRRRAARPQRPRRRRSRTRSRRSPRRTAAFTDDAAQTDALTVASGRYKVVFLAFPFEAYGTRPPRPT